MAHGGRRAGAGRKPGSVTKRGREAAERYAESGTTPLDYMVGVLRGTEVFDPNKFEAAKAAAPYIHPRLAAIEHSGTIDTRPATDLTDDELAAIARGSSERVAEEAPRKGLTH